MDLTCLIDDLRRPEAFLPVLKDAPASVELVQTHISVLFLTAGVVFKVKKPLDLGFLDFRSLDARAHFCREEVRLNAPLAPGVYVDVVPITRGPGARLLFGGDGPTVDWAVQMRRLPESRMLDVLLRSGEWDAVTADMLDSLAEKIARFHEGAPVCARDGESQRVRATVVCNLEDAREHVGSTLTRGMFEFLLDWSRAASERLTSLIEERMRAGLVRDIHGDLHSEHICFTDPLVVYDRLEFSEELRQIDVAAEVAFLAMDLDHRGRRDLGAGWIRSYCRHAGVDLPEDLLQYFLCHRACVRGKVLSIKSCNTEIPPKERALAAAKAMDYFSLAVGYALRSSGTRVVATSGPIASGKSLLASWLSERMGWRWLRADQVRKQLAGLAPTERPAPEEIAEVYGEEMNERTCRRLLDEARQELQSGGSVILDSTYRRGEDRDAVRALAAEEGATCTLLFLEARESTLRDRLEQREHQPEEISDARVDLLPSHLAHWEFPEPGEPALVRIDGEAPPREVCAAALDALLECDRNLPLE